MSCGAPYVGQLTCTRPGGHDGWHDSANGNGEARPRAMWKPTT